MSTSKTVATPRRRAVSVESGSSPTTSDELAQVMKKLQAIEAELAAVLERNVCDSLKASGEVAQDVAGTVRTLLGSAFAVTREVSQSLLQAATRTAHGGQATARDAVATIEDFALLAREAARQVIAGTAEGLAQVRESHRRPQH